MASVSSVSRVTDNRHHASDVWVGTLLGVLVAVVTAARMSQLPELEQQEQSGDSGKKQSHLGLLSSNFVVRWVLIN